MLAVLNRTHLEHTVIAACIQFALTPLLWLLAGKLGFAVIVAGALPGCFLFFGREHAQMERKLQKTSERTDNEAVIGAINCFRWSADGKLDFFCPVLGAILQAGLWLIAL